MCGFVAAFGRRGAPAPARTLLEAMLSDVRHRGPDAEGRYETARGAVYAARLSVQGDGRADPPLRSRDGRIVLAWNGEVLGSPRARLERLVRAAGGTPPDGGAGDGPLLAEALAALARHGSLDGPAAMALLEGAMGAFVAWDLERDEAWLVRDRLGVKPLHVAETEETVFVASEIRPLLRAVPGARRVDADGLATLLREQRPGVATPFRGIETVRPGGAWRVDRGGRVTRWAGGTGVRDLVDRSAPLATATRALGEAVADAAREAAEAARADAVPALFLSGGLDSAAVACLAGRGGTAFTGRFAPAGGDFDESGLARLSADAGGWAHEVVDLEDRDLVEDLVPVVGALELPLAGPGALALWRLARRARAVTKVVLTGTGGDELLGGYARTALALGRHGVWTEGYDALAGRIERAGLDAGARRRAAHGREEDLFPLLAPELRASLPEADPPAPSSGAGADDALERLVEDEVERTLPTLLHVEDRVLMANGLEGRPVLCLGDVPRAAARVPPEGLVGPDGEGKRALRLALAGRVPEAVRASRRKRGFPTPFPRAAAGPGRGLVRAVLEDRAFRERGWWDVAAVRRRLDAPVPFYDRSLYALLLFELWAGTFLDAGPERHGGPALRASGAASPLPLERSEPTA